ncbi:serine/threonine protein kinase [Oscillatoriales cyanobacterium LEGE 11467]|uniref:non-specific serine/threonine protein kinase n=1 Tax=Zarconia navalis LEGE 11467 TaxID=1828826 RepID=A0A928W0Q1_9CYAN|nr:serine/threonine-protein kinase [Zarconia navalis]MBE9041743.1 serine/threonine protein kinase [Zarconia navalis LEGE 11467]
MKNLLYQTNDIIRDRYRIVSPIGEGSMGTTYEAEDLTNYQRVAIKVVSLRQTQDWKIIELFDREARVLANLQHPGIPKYLDRFDEDTSTDRRFYLVQELAVGESLAALVEKGWQPDERRVRKMALQLLDILNYLHQLTPPVIHRDIKPQNIIRHTNDKLYLVDFGAVQDVYRNTLTRGGTFVGTLGYMPHEQFRGQVGAASDLYALGATLLFLLSGKSPAELPQTRMKIDFHRHVNISPALSQWLEKMLAPAVEDRFASAREAISALSLPLKPSVREVTSHNGPRGSRISLMTTENSLVCLIPLHWNLILSLTTITIVLSFFAWPIFILLAIPFISLLGSQSLFIDRQKFILKKRWFGICFQEIKGQTADIKLVDVEVTRGSKGKTLFNLVIWEGVRKYNFGGFISQYEKKWLEIRLSEFLNLRRLQPLDIERSDNCSKLSSRAIASFKPRKN